MKYFSKLYCLIFLIMPTPVLLAQWEPDVRLTNDPSYGYTSYNNARCIGTATGAVIHVVWYDGRNGGTCEIYTKRSLDGGLTWSTDTRLTDDPAQSDYPALAVQDTNLFVTWFDGRNGGWSVYTKCSTDGGNTWGPDVLQSNNNGANSMFPTICAAGPNVVVIWMDNRNGDRLYYVHSTDYGATWASEVQLTSTPSFFASLAAAGSNVHLVWEDLRSWYDIYYKRSTDGGQTWGPDILLSTASGFQTSYPSVSVEGANVHVAFQSNRTGNWEVFSKVSTDNGTTWGSDIQVSDADGASSYGPSISNSGSNVHVAWEDTRDGNREIYYDYSADFGATWKEDVRLTNNSLVSAWPHIAIADSIVNVIWSDTRDGNLEIYYKRNPKGNIGIFEAMSDRYRIPDIGFTVIPNPFISCAAILGHESENFSLLDISGRLVGKYQGNRVGANVLPGVYFLLSEKPNTRPVRIVKVR